MSLFLLIAIIEFIVFVGLQIILAWYWSSRIPDQIKITHYGIGEPSVKTYRKSAVISIAIILSVLQGIGNLLLVLAHDVLSVFFLGGFSQLLIFIVFAILYRYSRR